MLEIPRSVLRQYRAVCRRARRGERATQGRAPWVALRSGPKGAVIATRTEKLWLLYRHPGRFPEAELFLPADALAEFDGKGNGNIRFELSDAHTTIVEWDDGGFPQVRQYTHTDVPMTIPELAKETKSNGPELLEALAEADRTCDKERIRYALDCLELRGGKGEIAATDGKQLLVQGGFKFPWQENVLIHRTDVFAAKELCREEPVKVGKSDDHISFENGPWTILIEIEKEGRFPDIDRIAPSANAVTNRLQLDNEDKVFLSEGLRRLPGKEDESSPITIDCNGTIAVRAKGEEQEGRMTELVLARSGYTGQAVRFQTNRCFVERAVKLGFGEINVVSAKAPISCEDGKRRFLWQPLNPEGALEPNEECISVSSCPNGNSRTNARTERRTIPMPTGKVNGSQRVGGSMTSSSSQPTELGEGSVISQAEALKDALRDALMRTSHLVASLKRQKRQRKLVESTLASLKELQQVG